MMTHVLFEAPYNWCDSHCRRCALRNDCKVAIMMDCSSPRHRDDRDYLRRNDMPPDRSVLAANRLGRANLQLTRCVFKLEVVGVLDRERAAECLQLCLLLGGKSARVTSYSDWDLTGALASDALPNLLLIERTLTRLHQLLGPHDDLQTRSALREVGSLLAPLIARVDDGAREHLAQWVREGRAPSPFLVTSTCSVEDGAT